MNDYEQKQVFIYKSKLGCVDQREYILMYLFKTNFPCDVITITALDYDLSRNVIDRFLSGIIVLMP